MTAVAIQTGDRRGGYTFVRRIGKGAFGEVWRALHAPSGETVAVKVQAASPGRSAPLTRRIVQLRHPNIVMTRERVETDGLVLTVMELVEGRSLREELAERGTLPLDEAVEIADQLLQGLSHAHGAGVAHLDLKPENVLVAGRRARLCDFGSAREVAAAAAEPELTRSLDSEDPSAAHIVGSIGYMAPEQRLGFAHASTRSDIYSFGVILHEMLTGQLPLGAFRYPSAVHAEIPASVDDVVQRCLQPSPERRFADAEEARQALREAAIAPGGAVAPLQMRGVEEVRSVREFVEYVLGSPAGWEEGRRQLADGELESWLRLTRHATLSRAAERARSREADRDQALEAFLESSGVFEPPALDVDAPAGIVEMGEIRRGAAGIAKFRLIKRGRGYLAGELSASSPALGIRPPRYRLAETDRAVSETTLEIRIDTASMEPFKAFEETVHLGGQTLRVRGQVLPRPAELSVQPADLAVAALGERPVEISAVLENRGDEEAEVHARVDDAWLTVDAPPSLPPGGRSPIRVRIDPAAARASGRLVHDDRIESEAARAVVRFEAEGSAAVLTLVLIRARRFVPSLFLAGVAMGLVPIWAEILFLMQTAELGMSWLSPRAAPDETEEARRAAKRGQGRSLLLGLLPGLLLHLALIVHW